MSYSFQYLGKPDMSGELNGIRKSFLNNPEHFKIQKGTSKTMTKPHIHNYTQIWYVLNDSFVHLYKGRSYTQRRGDLLIVPPFFTHQLDTRNSTDLEFIFCELTDGFFDVIPNNKDKNSLFNLTYLRPLFMGVSRDQPFLSFKGEEITNIETLLLNLLHEYGNTNNISNPYLRVNIARLLALIARKFEETFTKYDDLQFAKYRSSIQEALNYIDAHFTERIHLQDICKVAMMSVCSFSYVFKQITGKTFLEYIHYLRIHHAQKFLKNTNHSMLSISLACGFYDEAHFCRVFKKLAEQSPKDYRKSNREHSASEK